MKRSVEKEKQIWSFLAMAQAMDEIGHSIADNTSFGEKMAVNQTRKALKKMLKHYEKAGVTSHEAFDECVGYWVEHFDNLIDSIQEPD